METLSHDEALEVVEAWVKREGIRSFCSYICKGDCCSGCTGCFNGDRRISCSVYLCSLIKVACERCSPNTAQDIIDRHNHISYYISSVAGKHVCGNPYFDPTSKEMKRVMKFDKDEIMRLNDIFLPKKWQLQEYIHDYIKRREESRRRELKAGQDKNNYASCL